MGTWDERMTPRAKPEPRLELLETCWRMRGPSGRVLTCGIYAVEPGLEVRAGYDDDLLYSCRIGDFEYGRHLADELGETVRRKGGFEDLPVER